MTAMTRAGTANDPTRTEEMKVRALCEGRIAATDTPVPAGSGSARRDRK